MSARYMCMRSVRKTIQRVIPVHSLSVVSGEKRAASTSTTNFVFINLHYISMYNLDCQICFLQSYY